MHALERLGYINMLVSLVYIQTSLYIFVSKLASTLYRCFTVIKPAVDLIDGKHFVL